MICQAKNKLCYHAKACDILGECVISHELVKNISAFESDLSKCQSKTSRMRYILKVFQAKKPDKVSAEQVTQDKLQTIYEKFDYLRDQRIDLK